MFLYAIRPTTYGGDEYDPDEPFNQQYYPPKTKKYEVTLVKNVK